MPKNKSDLIELIRQKTDLGRNAVEASIDAVLDGIATLAADDRLTLRGFGSFETRTRGARNGRNPRTGETIALPATSALAFRAAKSAS